MDNGHNPKTIDGALALLPDANLVLISTAGQYAGDLAMEALNKKLNVMLFSDNVELEKEIELKKYASQNDLLVMGPDCGTAIINGTPLAFANVVNSGNIGIVGASGTGIQEVSTIISNLGQGISQAIGTGGRDIKKEVGGITFIEAMKLLSEDPNTKVILLVSRPPDQQVLEKIIQATKVIEQKVVAVFLGVDKKLIRFHNIHYASNLEEAANIAAQLSQGFDNPVRFDQRDYLKNLARSEVRKMARGQTFIRALFSGGTFCMESQIILHSVLENIHSNVPVEGSKELESSWKSTAHTFLDFGEGEFTVGRPHPMIDYSVRIQRMIAEARDPETAAILFDLVLGFGSHLNPLAELLPAIDEVQRIARENRRYLPIICSVTGTDQDPQNRAKVVEGLKEGGVFVFQSNAEATKFAGYLILKLEEW